MPKVRIWLIGVACIAAGVISREVLVRYAQPGSRAEAYNQALILAFWFSLGLVLLAVPLVRNAYTPGDPGRGELVGCLLWVVAAFVAFCIVVAATGEH